MAKKHFGRLLAFAAIAGAAAGGISYFLRYKSFHKELDEDFHDFEDDFDGDLKEFESGQDDGNPVPRNYVSLNPERQGAKNDAKQAESAESVGNENAGGTDEAAGSGDSSDGGTDGTAESGDSSDGGTDGTAGSESSGDHEVDVALASEGSDTDGMDGTLKSKGSDSAETTAQCGASDATDSTVESAISDGEEDVTADKKEAISTPSTTIVEDTTE